MSILRNVIFLFLFLSSLISLSQNIEVPVTELGNNSVYSTIGYGYHNPEFSFGLGLNYERQLVKFNNSYLFAQVGWSYWLLWGVSANSYQLDLAYLIGGKNSYLELNLGVDYACIGNDFEGVFVMSGGDVMLLANIAYRYQRPGNRMIFRAGIGTVALAFISLGMSF